MSQGPQRLGGSVVKCMTPREAAAAAAERRARDNLWCPSAAIAAGEKVIIDLIDDSDDDVGPTNRMHPSQPVAATPPMTCSGATAATAKQQVPKVGFRKASRSDHGGNKAMAPQTAPTTGTGHAVSNLPNQKQTGGPSAASAAYPSKAAEAAAARAEAARRMREAAGPAPSRPTASAPRPRRPRPACPAQPPPHAPHNVAAPLAKRGHGKHVATVGHDHSMGTTGVRALGELDGLGSDSDDDIEIVRVCGCGSGTAATQSLQPAGEVACPRSSKPQKRHLRSAAVGDVAVLMDSSSFALGAEFDKQAQKSQRHDACDGAAAARAQPCPGSPRAPGGLGGSELMRLDNAGLVLSERNGRDSMVQQQNSHDYGTCRPEKQRDSLVDLT